MEFPFRRQAIEHQKDRLHGDLLLLPKLSHTLILSLLLAWLLLVFAWLFTSNYTRKETVSGWLEPASGVTRVYPQSEGVIKQLLVKEGETVSEGQPLMIVNGDHTLVDGTVLEEQLLKEYQGQIGTLTEQMERSHTLFERNIADTNGALETAREDLTLIMNQTGTLKQRLDMVTQREQRYQKLFTEHHISEEEYNNVKGQALAVKSELQALRRDRLHQISEVSRLKSELHKLPMQHANELNQLKSRLSDLARKSAQLHGDRAHVIKAPHSGTVSNLLAREGQQSRLGLSHPLLTIVPEGSHLTAELLVPVRASGFVAAGQTVSIRYDAFPYQKFGLYAGDIQRVSKSLLLPEELAHAPVQPREAVYRVKIALNDQEVMAFGQPMPLKPGMTLSADIKFDDRSLMKWLLEPLYNLKGRI